MSAARIVAEIPGNDPPAHRPSTRLTGPATSPFNSTICNGSANDTFRVRLLSRPHMAQAPTMASGPITLFTVGVPAQARTTAPATRHAMPSAILRSKFSWKMNHAMSAVAAPSSVSRSDAAAASVRVSPTINNMGPAMPPAAIAPASQRMSCCRSGCSGAPEPMSEEASRRNSATPTPAPQ